MGDDCYGAVDGVVVEGVVVTHCGILMVGVGELFIMDYCEGV